MVNYISKLMTSSQLKFTVLGLIVSVGVSGVSYASEQHYKLLSSTALAANYDPNSDSAFSSGLKEIQQESFPVSQINTSNQVSGGKLTENITTLSANTRELGRKGKVQFPEEDGIYLYGQSVTPNQLGQGYILFQKQQGKIIGTLYVPQSEFSCFQGTLAKSGELAMTVRSSPGEVGAMEVSTRSTIPKISDESTTYAHSLTLQDYHQLSYLSANDKEMLETCKQQANGIR